MGCYALLRYRNAIVKAEISTPSQAYDGLAAVQVIPAFGRTRFVRHRACRASSMRHPPKQFYGKQRTEI